MKALGKLLVILLVLAILAALGTGVYFAGKFVVGVFAELDEEWLNIFIAVCIGVLFVALVIAAAARAIGGYYHRNRMRLEKAKVYERFLEAWSDALTGEPGDARRRDALRAAERELIVWGGGNVLRQYEHFQAEAPGSDDSDAVAEMIEQMLKEIRRDLGLRSFGFRPYQLTRLLLGAEEDVPDESANNSGAGPVNPAVQGAGSNDPVVSLRKPSF